MAKLPNPDPARIAGVPAEVVSWADPLWRIHASAGPHALRWDELRGFGPLASARFDPWPPPPRDHRPDGVGYLGADWPACLAEVFQQTRVVHPDARQPRITAIDPARPLRLLDLRGEFPIRVGSSHAICSAAKNRCRAWAIALRAAHPDLDGLIYTGMAGDGHPCFALFAPADDAFGPSPGFSRLLADAAIASRLAGAAAAIGYEVRLTPRWP